MTFVVATNGGGDGMNDDYRFMIFDFDNEGIHIPRGTSVPHTHGPGKAGVENQAQNLEEQTQYGGHCICMIR